MVVAAGDSMKMRRRKSASTFAGQSDHRSLLCTAAADESVAGGLLSAVREEVEVVAASQLQAAQ